MTTTADHINTPYTTHSKKERSEKTVTHRNLKKKIVSAIKFHYSLADGAI